MSFIFLFFFSLSIIRALLCLLLCLLVCLFAVFSVVNALESSDLCHRTLVGVSYAHQKF